MSNDLWVWRDSKIKVPSLMSDGNPWPKVSVITPSYNQGRYIEETIRSVIMQGYPNLEYIIIDGRSEDSTVDIIEKYSSEITYWISEKDNGQTHAINKGFARATGEILAYLNSDDLHMPYTLKLVAELFAAHRLDWLTGFQSRLVNEEVIAPKRDAVKLFNNELYRKGYHVGSMFGWNQQCSTFWSKSLFDQVGRKFDESFHHAMDIDMWIRMSSFADLVSVEAVLAMMRLHGDQKSRNINIAETEIERKRKEYGLARYALRKVMFRLFKLPVLRNILRMIWCRGEGRYLIWNVKNSSWSMASGYIK